MEEIEEQKDTPENQESPSEAPEETPEPTDETPETSDTDPEPDELEATPAPGEEEEEEQEVVRPQGTVHARPEPGEPKKRKKVDLESPEEKLKQRAYALSTGSVRDHEISRGSAGGEVSTESEDTYSTGFILGVALIVVSLIGGVMLVRLNGKVNQLENRLESIEQALAQSGSGPVALRAGDGK